MRSLLSLCRACPRCEMSMRARRSLLRWCDLLIRIAGIPHLSLPLLLAALPCTWRGDMDTGQEIGA